jgi:hypothetical protein
MGSFLTGDSEEPGRRLGASSADLLKGDKYLFSDPSPAARVPHQMCAEGFSRRGLKNEKERKARRGGGRE